MRKKVVRKRIGEPVDKIEMIEFGITTGARDQQIAEHFGYRLNSWRSYKSELKKSNPDLIDKLDKAQKAKGNKRQKTAPDKMAQYGIETGATDEQIAEHFGYKLHTWQAYKYALKKTNHDLIEQLTVAQKRNLAITKSSDEVAQLQEENRMLKEENRRLKARITLLEQELPERSSGLQTTKPEFQGQQQKSDSHQINESEFDVLMRVFNQGNLTAHDAEILLQFQHKLEKIQQGQSRNYKWRNSLNYSTMISMIRTILTTKTKRYQAERLPELRRFISTEYEGPLYEIDENASIGRLATIIEKRTGMKVYPEELVLIINRLIEKGKGNEISENINTDAIANMRSRLELCYEQIRQEGLLLTGEAR